ncbi:hypothetical protein C0995_008310 [Termitomyces sp. Mi166|nr:hypothetical protein C0995_008310 [Termitomyces sp. Mi166\
MSKNSSDEASNQAKFEVREGERERFSDDASGGKGMALESQGSSRRGNHYEEESKLRRTAPSMNITRPESLHPRCRHGSDATDSEVVASDRRGANHLRYNGEYSEMARGRGQNELEYVRAKEEVRNAKDTELLVAQAEAGNLGKKLEASERQSFSKGLEDERRKKRDLRDAKAQELAFAQKEAYALRRKLEKTEKDIRWFTEHYELQKQELQVVREQLRQVQIVHERTRHQLAERTAELQSAQLFIDVADSLSGADIISMTADLNAEILQSAALMADSLDYTKKQEGAAGQVVLEVQKTIGETLTKALANQRSVDGKNVDPTLVQLALQVCLVECSKVVITSWTLNDNDAHLSEIYSRIWSEKKQSVAGRWRSMTQMHGAAANGSKSALQMIVHSVKSVLIVTGINYRPFSDQFQEKLATINALSLRLRSSIGQHITSMEIRPFTIEPGITFDPGEMDDTYAEERNSKSMAVEVRERVAGSTELGLISQVREIDGKVKTKVMLKPKVVLCSALTEDG